MRNVVSEVQTLLADFPQITEEFVDKLYINSDFSVAFVEIDGSRSVLGVRKLHFMLL